jgi:hypothetical protein
MTSVLGGWAETCVIDVRVNSGIDHVEGTAEGKWSRWLIGGGQGREDPVVNFDVEQRETR